MTGSPGIRRPLRSLLIVTPNFWPETFRINEVAEVLAATGIRVTVLTGQPNYPEGRTYPGYAAWRAGWTTTPFGVRVARVPVVTRGTAGPIRLALSYAAFFASIASIGPILLRGRRFDAILYYGVSPIVPALAACWLRLLKGTPFALWVQDLWPGNLDAAGFRLGSPVLVPLRRLMRCIYRRSDAVLVASRGFDEDIRLVAGADIATTYQPNPAEVAVMDGLPASPVPGSGAGSETFDVVFAGNLGRALGIDTILDAATRCLPDAGIRFRLVGGGSMRGYCADEIARRGLTNTVLEDRVPAAQMPAILAGASALLITLVRSHSMNLSLPSKTATYMASGRPIIVSADGETSRIVEEAGAGYAVPAEDAAALADAIQRMKALPGPAREAMGAAARRYCEAHFEPRHLAARLVANLEAMMERYAAAANGGRRRP
jgi:glycosyltransferase involved in cell wall biosynthesis